VTNQVLRVEASLWLPHHLLLLAAVAVDVSAPTLLLLLLPLMCRQ
jgi:hypothetical protein